LKKILFTLTILIITVFTANTAFSSELKIEDKNKTIKQLNSEVKELKEEKKEIEKKKAELQSILVRS
jgi:uncharacterized protein YxeA